MTAPRLSVLVPNYNHARFLPAALDAILSQSYRPLEIVIADDGSTDGSLAILRGYETRQPDLIRVVENERNLGVIATLQRLLAMAAGDYVYFAAADDRVLPGFFERSMALLARHSGTGLCSTLSRSMSEAGVLQGVIKTAVVLPADGCMNPTQVLLALRRHGGWFMGNTTITRRDALIDAGGFRADLGAYCDGFVYPVLALKYGACFIPEPLAVWRRMAASYSQRTRGDVDAVLRVLEHAERLMRTDYADLFPAGYIDDWKREIYFGAALPFARSGGAAGRAAMMRLVPSTTVADRLFHFCARIWPPLGRLLAAPYLFLKLRRAHLWRTVERRLAHARLSMRSA